MPNSLPNPKELRKLLEYNPATGKLFWLERTPDWFSDGRQSAEHTCRRWNTRYAGKEAFTSKDKDGYSKGSIFRCDFRAHRVIWAMAHNDWPPETIDHINGVKDDNRIENLRAVTHIENLKNQKLPSSNTSGHMGVCWRPNSSNWEAQIKVNGRQIYLGRYVKKDDAIAARKAAEVNYGYHVNHGRTL